MIGKVHAWLRRNLRRGADLAPPTWRGVLVAAFSGLALLRYGLGSLDLVLFVLGIAGLSLVFFSLLLVGISALVLRRRIRGWDMDSRRLEAGSPLHTGFAVPAFSWLPIVKVAWEWLEPPDVDCRIRSAEGELLEEVVAHRRARLGHVRRRMSVFGVFGLSRVTWERREPASLLIVPNVGRLRSLPVVRSMASSEGLPHPSGAPEGDRMEIRRYVPGDSVRSILWKAFARTRQLNVRLPERSVDRSRKTVAYLLAGDGDEAAAAAARVALEQGIFGDDWLFGADGSPEPVEDLGAALEAIAQSGSLDAPRETDFELFLSAADVRGEVHCVVFAPALEGAWLERALAGAQRRPGRLSFVLGTDGISRREPQPLWRRMLFDSEVEEGATADELARVLRRLAAVGPTLVVDRVTGRAYGEAQQQALGGAA